MKKILCFILCPLVFICSNIPYLDEMLELKSYMLFLGIDFLISIILYGLINKILKQTYKIQNIVICILIGSGIDQALKLIIYKFNLNIDVLGELLQIKQTKNENQMAALNTLNIELNTTVIVIIKSVLLIVICLVLIKSKKKNYNFMYAFLFLTMAALSNLADSVFWGYTLDYVYFYHLTCYDLKDFYVDIAIGCFLIYVFENELSLNKNNVTKV